MSQKTRTQQLWLMHKQIHNMEVRELTEAVTRFGGKVIFGEEYTGEYATGEERPLITVNLKFAEGPEDVYIESVSVEDGKLTIIADHKEWDEPFILDTDDIEFGHVSFITDLIPDVENDADVFILFGDEKAETYFNEGNVEEHISEFGHKLVERRFNTMEERRAYMRGVCDGEGWKKHYELTHSRYLELSKS